MADYDSMSAEEYRAQLEQMGANEEDVRAAVEELEGRR
jgi:hypothetical protein